MDRNSTSGGSRINPPPEETSQQKKARCVKEIAEAYTLCGVNNVMIDAFELEDIATAEDWMLLDKEMRNWLFDKVKANAMQRVKLNAFAKWVQDNPTTAANKLTREELMGRMRAAVGSEDDAAPRSAGKHHLESEEDDGQDAKVRRVTQTPESFNGEEDKFARFKVS